jgi:hypothetical protein
LEEWEEAAPASRKEQCQAAKNESTEVRVELVKAFKCCGGKRSCYARRSTTIHREDDQSSYVRMVV